MPASLTASTRLDWLQRKREAEVAEVAAINERSVAEDRDLSDDEANACQRRRDAVERLDREISVEVDAAERQGQYEALAHRIEPALRSRSVSGQGAPAEAEVLYRSAGEYLYDVAGLRAGDHEARARLERYQSTLDRAHQTTADNLAIVPVPVLAPVINDINARRPAIEAATRRPLPPDGVSFKRPRISQHVAVGKQTSEKATLDSRKLLMTDLTIDLESYGGYINLSFQNRDRTSPSIIDIIVQDLANQYAIETDQAFCTAFTAAVTQTVSATTGATPVAADAESWLGGIFDAAAMVFGSGNAQPDVIWAAPNVWSSLGRLVDGSGRPMFPAVGPANALGALNPGNIGSGNVGGFKLVVDSNLADGVCILGDSRGVEFFEQVGGQVSAVEPSVLGLNIAYWGMAATCVVRPESFVKIISV